MKSAESTDLQNALRQTVTALETMTRELSHMLAPGHEKPVSIQEVRRVLTIAAHTLGQIGQRMDRDLPLPPSEQDR